MRIRVNGSDETHSVRTLSELLLQRGTDVGRVVVAHNESCVPRSQLQEVVLEAGDRVEILAAMQGG